MTQPSPEAVEKMEVFVRRMAQGIYLHGCNEVGFTAYEAVAAAQGLVAMLPEPVDPDLIEAREIVARSQDPYEAIRTRAGLQDNLFRVADTLAGIRAGRALAESGK